VPKFSMAGPLKCCANILQTNTFSTKFKLYISHLFYFAFFVWLNFKQLYDICILRKKIRTFCYKVPLKVSLAFPATTIWRLICKIFPRNINEIERNWYHETPQ
jgi:hypothetical protein